MTKKSDILCKVLVETVNETTACKKVCKQDVIQEFSECSTHIVYF